MRPSFAFLVHPLVGWHRRVAGVRRGHASLLIDGPAGIEAVGVAGRLRFRTEIGEVDGVIVTVPDLADRLVSDQQRALTHLVRAAAVARDEGAQVIGLGSALAVTAGRGRPLAERAGLPVTTGHAATAWAAASITETVHTSGPVAVLGSKGTVGDAVAARLARRGHTVWVEDAGPRSRRRARDLGARTDSTEAILARCRVVVGASTTGPTVAASALHRGTTLVDVALPPTLRPGRRRAGVRVVAGETLAVPHRVRRTFWGGVWLTMAAYGRGSVFACLAEPLVLALEGGAASRVGRRVRPEELEAVGASLTRAGFMPVVRGR